MFVNIQKFMVEEPSICSEETSMHNALYIFWAFSLRHLPIVNEETKELEGIITRENVVSF